MDADAYRRESRRRWGESAAGWKRRDAFVGRAAMPVSAWLVDALELQPGHRVLELAAGTGEVGLLAHELIQPGGELIISDFAPEMLTAAQERVEARGLRGVRFKQIDAESIDLEAASLDGVLCRWGYMLMADPGAALRETRRVLRPGGRVALAAWTGPQDNPWSALIGRELVRRGAWEPPDPEEPGQFAWAEEGVVGRLLAEAGFADVEVDVVAFENRYASFEDWIASQRDLSLRTDEALRTRPDTDQILEALRAAAAPYAREDGSVVMPARTWVAVAEA
jgi:SAM-dependent methyltransferase